jgi:Family of unknown function (DUF6152)
MRTAISAAIGAILLAATTAPSAAHHSGAMFEPEKIITLRGTVKEFEYANPHSWLWVVVTDANGTETLWGFESEGPSTLLRAGIKKTSLKPGDKVTVRTRPLRDGRPAGVWVTVIKDDGTELSPRPAPMPTPASTGESAR